MVNVLPGPVQVLHYIDTKMAWDLLKRLSGSSRLWRAEEAGAEIDGKSFQLVMQVWHLWKETQKEGLGAKSLTLQHGTEKSQPSQRGVLLSIRIGEDGPTLAPLPCSAIGWCQPRETAPICRLSSQLHSPQRPFWAGLLHYHHIKQISGRTNYVPRA